MFTRLVTLALCAGALSPSAARADEMTELLRGGPLVRIESTEAGRFKEGLAIADIDAPVQQVWDVLTDFDNYRFFMPRIDELKVERDGRDFLVEFDIDTPLVSTRYTNRYTLDEKKRVVRIRQVKGDLDGSHYFWRLVSLGPARTRVYYGGVVKNFSSIAKRLEDDQQTITVGINVASLLAALRAVEARAEMLHRRSKTRPAAPATR
jgi:ribosome-associated toxin RatA of RatAB toxin-antitoxin module